MLFKKIKVRFTKEFTLDVIFPESATLDDIEKAIDAERERGDDYSNSDEWETTSYGLETINVPPEDCRVTMEMRQNGRGYRVPKAKAFRGPDTMIADGENGFADPLDVEWWQVDDDQLEDIQARERRLQDINHPDQMHLPLGAKP